MKDADTEVVESLRRLARQPDALFVFEAWMVRGLSKFIDRQNQRIERLERRLSNAAELVNEGPPMVLIDSNN